MRGKLSHGESSTKTVEYIAWMHMKARCLCKSNKHYHLYGGRGITVCREWLNSYDVFLIDMGRRPSTKHSLDRINNNGNYEPTNCRWTDFTTQQMNKRQAHLIEFNGDVKNVRTWEIEYGLTKGVLHHRLNLGWSMKDALNRPVRGKRRA